MSDYTPRLKELYNKDRAKLQEELGLKNINQFYL